MQVVPLNEMPRLSWLLRHEPGSGRSLAFVGRDVEHGDDWLVEGVWAGPFEPAGFVDATHFFGSGVVVRDGRVTIVPASATTDRVWLARSGGEWLASNDALLLFSFTGARLDPEHNYAREAYSINHGVNAFDPTFHVLPAPIERFEQHYYDLLVIEGDTLTKVRRGGRRHFASYAEYKAAVDGEIDAIFQNAHSPARARRLSAFTSLSVGYDSTAVAALVARHGVDAAFTSRQSSSPIPLWLSDRALDDGTATAHRLGMPVKYLNDAPDELDPDDEVLFLAANLGDSETVFHRMAHHIERSAAPAMVFSGYGGDSIWGRNVEPWLLADDLPRDGSTGRVLAEIRLKAGFINVPLPFLFARELPDLQRISESEEMKPWRLDNDYDRPIARRIAEEAGLPRESFGMRKSGLARNRRMPLSPIARERFVAWLADNRIASRRVLQTHLAVNEVIFRTRRLALLARTRSRGKTLKIYTPRVLWRPDLRLPDAMYRWAVEEGARRLHPVTARIKELSDESHAPHKRGASLR